LAARQAFQPGIVDPVDFLRFWIMSDYFGDDSIHGLGHHADFVLAVARALAGHPL